MRKNLILLLLLIALPLSCRKPVEKKHIAFFIPYERGTQIYNSYRHSAEAEFSDTSRYTLHFYYVYDTKEPYVHKDYERDMSRQFRAALRSVRNEGVDPDLIVIYGDYVAQAAARVDDPMVKETPVICAGVVVPEWKGRLAGMKNVVVMASRPEVKKNLDFIEAMGFPSYVVTVMDSTFVDDRIREAILEQIGSDTEHYRANLHLEDEDRLLQTDGRDPRITLFPISTMWPEKNNRHPGQPGAFKIEWIFDTRQRGTSFLHLKEDEYADLAMSYNIGHYFAMVPEYFNLPLVNALNSCIGGYFTPFPSMWEQIHPIADRLLAGEPASQIPWGTLRKDYWLDWRMVKNRHPYASDFPKGVNFVNLPFFSRSRAVVLLSTLGVVLLVVLFVVFALIIPLTLFHRQRRQRIQLYDKAKEAARSENQIQYILSQLKSYLWRALPDGTLKFSPSFYGDFCIPEGRVMTLDDILPYVHEPGRSSLVRLFGEEDLDSGQELDLVLTMPDGGSRAILMHAMTLPQDAPDGKNLKAGFFYFNDEAYRRNEDLRHAYRRSEEVKEKEQFLTSVNDGFHKPVENILFFSRLLAGHFRELSEEQKSQCEENVMESNRRLLELLDRVMGDTISAREFDSMMISLLDVEDLMEDVYVAHSVYGDGENQLRYVPGPAGLEIEADRSVFIQVMNSLVAGSLGAVEGTVEIGWTENAGVEVVVYIENSTDSLSNCEQMVTSMGGRISVMTTSRATSRIELVFPVVSPPPQPIDLQRFIL